MTPRGPFPAPPLPASDDYVALAEELNPRQLTCAHYNACLDHVLEQHWASWQCPPCTEFQAMAPEDLMRDLEGCFSLLVEAYGKKMLKDLKL